MSETKMTMLYFIFMQIVKLYEEEIASPPSSSYLQMITRCQHLCLPVHVHFGESC